MYIYPFLSFSFIAFNNYAIPRINLLNRWGHTATVLCTDGFVHKYLAVYMWFSVLLYYIIKQLCVYGLTS